MNTATKITVLRLVLIPVLILFFCIQQFNDYIFIGTGLTFFLASVTDFLDGHIARKYNMVTDLGKFLDPIADKVLVVAGLFIVVAGGYVPTPYVAMIFSIIIMARELIIGLLRQIAALKNYVLQADNLGKAKTMATMLALGCFLFAPPSIQNTVYGTCVMIIGYILFVLATILTIVSGANYIKVNKELIFGGKND